MTEIRKETDSLGEIEAPSDKLCGAQTQRSLEHFSIGQADIARLVIKGPSLHRTTPMQCEHE